MSEPIVVEKSQITVETRAKGMLAKLAHDLRIDVESSHFTFTREGSAAKLAGSLRGEHLKVAGALKSGAVDRNVLSASDIQDIQEKIRSEVLERPIEIEARCELGEPAPASLRVSIDLSSRGKKVTTSVTLTTEVTGDAVRARGSFTVQLTSLGITPPKGPLNAFRVDDEVRVGVDVTVRLPATA